MPDLSPVLVHGHPGPNPWKINILLEELNVPYTTKIWTTPQLKQPEFLALNRAGLSPVIQDPNSGDLLLAETSAITDYLLATYDKSNMLIPSASTAVKEHFLVKQWLFFQNTAQGPLLQHIFHWSYVEKDGTARASYVKRFRDALRLLDDELADKDWLVGGKCSAADLSFVPFHSRIPAIMGDAAPDMAAEFPRVDAWYKRMCERASVQKVLADHAAALKSVMSSLPQGVK